MRVIQLKQDEYDDIRLLGYMLYPECDDSRSAHDNLCILERKVLQCQPSEEFVVSAGMLNELINLPSKEERLKEGMKLMQHGTLAGSVMHIIRTLHESSMQPSIGKAIDISQDYYQNSTQANQKVKPVKRETYNGYVSKFRAVLHFWAAHVFLRSNPKIIGNSTSTYETIGKYSLPTTHAEIIEFLLIAEMFQDFGLAYREKRSKEPLLYEDTAWRIDTKMLPDNKLAIGILEPAPWIREAAKNYKRKSR